MSENNKPHTPILDQLTEMNKAIEYAQMAYHDFLSNNVAAVLAELDRVHERPGYKRGNSALLTAIAKEAGLGQSSRHAMRFIWAHKALKRGYVTEDDIRKALAAGASLSFIGQLLEHPEHGKPPTKTDFRKRLAPVLKGERGAITKGRTRGDGEERKAA